MAQKETIIIELDFDTSDFTKEAAALNKEISDLNKEQKELKKNGEEGSIQYQKNTEALRENKKELRETNKTIDQLNQANKSSAGSNEQLRAQLSILTKEYNGLSEAERENSSRGQELNAQLNQITETLKENEEGIGDNRRSVGDYGKALDGTPFGSFIGGIKSMAAAFIANPIGIVIAAIAAAIALLTKAFNRNEDSSNKLGEITDALGGAFNFLLSVLEPVANFIADVVIKAFNDLGEIVEGTIGLIGSALDALGFGDAANDLNEWNNAANQAIKDAQALGAAQDELVKSQRNVRLIQLESLKDAEKQRQIRDDESLSIDERIAANEKLGKILEEQSRRELEIANEALRIAEERIRLEGASTDLLDARADALVEVADIQERITGQQSEQLVNINSLERDRIAQQEEAAAKRLKIVQDAINQSKEEISLFIANQGVRAKSLEDELALEEQIVNKKIEILERELAAKLITQTQFETQKLELQNEFLAKQAEAVIENADRELQILLDANQSKLDANQFFNDELLAQEQKRLKANLDAELKFQALRLEQGVISEQEYNDAINLINQENQELNDQLEEEREIAAKEKAIEDLAIQREIDVLNNEDEFALRKQDLDRQKAQELENAESTGADTELINKKFALLDKKLDQEKFANKLSIASGTFANLAEIAGKESAAGKSFAIAQTTIDTFVGAQAAFNSLASIPIVGPVLGGIAAAAAVAGGFARINKIRNTAPPKAAKGGVFGGKPHSQGGTKGYFDDGTQIEVESGELFAVVNKNSTGMINELSDLNVAGGGVSFGRGGTKSFLQDGGIAIDNVSAGVEGDASTSAQIINAVESLPTPVVTVQDINEVQGDTAAVVDRANL